MATAVRHLNGMSEQARACLREAAKCERAAVLATGLKTQAIYRELAAHWREMVEHYGQLDRLRGGQLQTKCSESGELRLDEVRPFDFDPALSDGKQTAGGPA